MQDPDTDIELYDEADKPANPEMIPMLSIDETNLDIQNLVVDSQEFGRMDSCHTEDVVERGSYPAGSSFGSIRTK